MRSRDLALTPFAAVLAPPTTSIACQCEWDHANREEYAERQHHPQPIGVPRRLLVSINAIDHSGDQPESNSSARLARSGTRPEKSGSRDNPPAAKRDARECEKLQKVPRRRGAARKDKLLESPNFLCELVMFHLAAGQPCFMGWQNRKTALRLRPADPAPGAVLE